MATELIEETALADKLARIDAELNAIALTDYPHQSHIQARETAAKLRRIQSRVATHVGAAVRAVQWTGPGHTSTRNIARDFGNDNRAVQRELKNAETTSKATRAEQAAADGTISHRHATVIGKAMDDLPPSTTADQQAWCEKALIRDAAHYSPADLATRGRRTTDQFRTDPDHVDADEDAHLR